MKKFEIGSGVTCDLDRLVDTRLLVQANSGGGKSWLLRRLLEQTHGHVQHLVIDPEGEFASLRERFDYVLAAKSGGDTAADPRSAALLAERLLELKVSAILDIYELKPHERILFVKRFLEALVNAPKGLWHPALVVVDEAHVYCPEAGQAESADAVKDLATRGRKRGFCAVLATQRLSKLHKDAAAECNNKLIGRTTLDVDVKRAANELGVTDREALLILRSLDPGEFFAYGPALHGKATEHGVYRTRTGGIETTHPKAGARLAFTAPPPTSKITALLPKLADLPAEVVEREKSIDTLKRENANLRRDLTVAQKAQPSAPKVESPKVGELKQELARHRRALGEAMKILAKVKALGFPVETDEDRKGARTSDRGRGEADNRPDREARHRPGRPGRGDPERGRRRGESHRRAAGREDRVDGAGLPSRAVHGQTVRRPSASEGRDGLGGRHHASKAEDPERAGVPARYRPPSGRQDTARAHRRRQSNQRRLLQQPRRVAFVRADSLPERRDGGADRRGRRRRLDRWRPVIDQ